MCLAGPNAAEALLACLLNSFVEAGERGKVSNTPARAYGVRCGVKLLTAASAAMHSLDKQSLTSARCNLGANRWQA
jgi:hypothetical protein